jgi:hypothetical protein
LELAQKTELLQLDIAEEPMGLRMMQNIEQESPVDRNLMRCPHTGRRSFVLP